MQTPLQITFHQIDSSEAVADAIREKVANLERFYDKLISCRVVVERPQHLHHNFAPYSVRVELEVPGTMIVGGGAGSKNEQFEDVYVAIRESFAAAKRQLQDYVRKTRHETKVHEVPPHGTVERLHTSGDYGFLRTSDGIDVYFHRNAVVDGEFDDLKEGDQVRFILHAEEGEHGPQASSVHALGKRLLPDVEAVNS